MPSTSEKQRRLMAIAEHHPEKVYQKNKAVTKISHGMLHDFASSVKKASSKIASLHNKSKK